VNGLPLTLGHLLELRRDHLVCGHEDQVGVTGVGEGHDELLAVEAPVKKDRLKKALENDPPPEERKGLAKNAMRAMKRLMNKRYKSSRVRKFVEKIKRGYPFWFTFVTVPGVEPTNNRAERALRELVVHRKIIGTLRNQKGVQIYETLPTLLATWKQRGLNLQEALSNALTEAWQRIRENERNRRPAA
jgi:hypothetical protein